MNRPTTHSQENFNQENISKFRKLVEDIKFCMFVTRKRGEGETLRSCPMTLQQVDENNDLWFFVGRTSELYADVMESKIVNLVFSCPEKSSYVSVIAECRESDSRAKKEELFNLFTKAWFPEGVDDKNLVLLHCKTESIDYWDSPSSKVVQIYALAKAIVTGKPIEDDAGIHGHIDVAAQEKSVRMY